MILRPNIDANRVECHRIASPQLWVSASHQNLGHIAPTAVDRQNVITAGEQLEAPWLVEPVTCQM